MLLAAHESRREILGYQSRFAPPTVAPGQKLRGCSVSPALSCISFRRLPKRLIQELQQPRDRAKGSAGTFQRGKFPEATSVQLQTGNALLKSSAANSHTIPGTRSIHQAWIDSRNQTTIATRLKHRQLIFLHPSCRKRSKMVQPASANLVSGSWRALAAPAC